MATPLKVREFLNTAGTETVFLAIGKVAAKLLATSLLASNDIEASMTAKIIAAFCEQLEPLMQEQVTKFIGEQFTDDDLAQIIAYRTSPVGQKAQEAVPQFQHQMATYLEDNAGELQRIMAVVCRRVTGRS
jgi:hypothetical protein